MIKKIVSFSIALLFLFAGFPNSFAKDNQSNSEHLFTFEELAGLGYFDSYDIGDEFCLVKRVEGIGLRASTAYYIIRQYNGKMLTSPSSGAFSMTRYSDGESNNHSKQKWIFTGDGSGKYIVYSNTDNTKCLTVNPNTKKVSLSNYSNSQYQKWQMAYSTNNGNALVCAATDSAVNGYKLVINTDDMRVSNTTYTKVGFFQVSNYIPTTALSHDAVYIALKDTKTLGLVTSPNNATCSNAWVVWESSSSIVSVSSGVVTGNVVGTTTLTFTDKITRVSGSCLVTVRCIPNGEYYIRNKKTKRYADIKNQEMSNGTIVHQWSFTGDATQRWVFNLQSNGYYIIKSANSSSAYKLAVKDDGTNDNQPIVIQSGTISDGMRWKINAVSSGAYKIQAKVGEANNRALAVNNYLLNINGIDLKQKNYVADSNYIDEWYIIDASEEFSFAKMASEGSFDFSAVDDSLNKYAHKRCEDYSGITKQEYLSLLTGTEYNCTIAHGDDDERAIMINNSQVLELSEIAALPSSNFNSTKLIILVSCYSGYCLGPNFVDTLRSKGVDVVVGFTGDIEVNCSLLWAEEFIKALSQVNTVQEADTIADDAVRDAYPGSYYELVVDQVVSGGYFGNTNLQTILFNGWL